VGSAGAGRKGAGRRWSPRPRSSRRAGPWQRNNSEAEQEFEALKQRVEACESEAEADALLDEARRLLLQRMIRDSRETLAMIDLKDLQYSGCAPRDRGQVLVQLDAAKKALAELDGASW